MNTSNQIRILAVASVFLLMAAGCGKTLKVGDTVLGKWTNNQFFLGTIAEKCEGGFTIKWNDGSEPLCVNKNDVVKDIMLKAGDVKVGSKVLAKWGSAFYESEVTKVEGETYSVRYSDGTSGDGLSLSDLRKR